MTEDLEISSDRIKRRIFKLKNDDIIDLNFKIDLLNLNIDINKYKCGQLIDLEKYFEKYILRFNKISKQFFNLNMNLEKKIELEIIPDRDLDNLKVGFPRRKFIVKNNREYRILDFNMEEDIPVNDTNKSFGSIAESVDYLNNNGSKYLIESKVLVNNTQNLPLENTVIPIIIEKYKKIIN